MKNQNVRIQAETYQRESSQTMYLVYSILRPMLLFYVFKGEQLNIIP